jgi:Tfp pilus assembly protein PilV
LTAETDHFKNQLEIDLRKEFEEEYSDSEFKRQNERQSNLIRNLRFELHAKNSQLEELNDSTKYKILSRTEFDELYELSVKKSKSQNESKEMKKLKKQLKKAKVKIIELESKINDDSDSDSNSDSDSD